MKVGDCSNMKRWSTQARKKWYGFYRTLRHSRRLLHNGNSLSAMFNGRVITVEDKS